MSTPVVDVPRPDVVPAEPYTFPEAQRRMLPNGLEVVLHEDKSAAEFTPTNLST